MMREIGRRNYFLEVVLTNKQVQIPVIEVVGANPGSTLILVAGLHGDEYEGTQTLFLLNQELDPDRLHGRVISITIGNPLAHSAKMRSTPETFDGKNLARAFPGNPKGSETERIASKIWELIAANCDGDDLVIDLHSGGQHYSYAHMAGVREMLLQSDQTLKSIQAARAMMIEQLWFMDPTPGTLSTVSVEHGIPSIGCEMEGRGGLNLNDVATCLAGVQNVMKLTGHDVTGKPQITKSQFKRTVTVNSKTKGFASVLPERFSYVEKGDPICIVMNEFGEPIEEITSPCKGQIWASRTNPSISEDEIIALIQISSDQ